jgi:hypothetical protein
LSILPDIVENIDGTNHYTARIPMDPEIEKRLRDL